MPSAQSFILITYEPFNSKLSPQFQSQIAELSSELDIQVIQLRYIRFGFKKLFLSIIQFVYLFFLVFKYRIALIHCFGTPAGAIGYPLSFLSRSKLIIDSYEPHAESMVENGTWKKRSLSYFLLSIFEYLQTTQASHIIGTTLSMKDYAFSRYHKKITSFYVKPACVDLDRFHYNYDNLDVVGLSDISGKFVGIYAGKLGGSIWTTK